MQIEKTIIRDNKIYINGVEINLPSYVIREIAEKQEEIDKIIETIENREALLFFVQKGLWCFLGYGSIYKNFVIVEFEDAEYSKISFVEAYYDDKYSSSFKVLDDFSIPERLVKSIRYNSNRAIYIEKL